MPLNKQMSQNEQIRENKKSTDLIPQWHILELRKRFAEYKSNPSIAIDFDSAMNDIEKELVNSQ